MSNVYVPELPGWDADGFLPRVHPITLAQSPYKLSSEQLVSALGITPDRKRLLHGWLALRQELYKIGLVDGWQWLDGSFAENVEESENRSPNDIDVVTFVRYPRGVDMSFLQKHQRLLKTQTTKIDFNVDAYYVDIENLSPYFIADRIQYWGNWWSHTRRGEEKGFIEVRLSAEDDRLALEILNSSEEGVE